MSALNRLNSLTELDAEASLYLCCSSTSWARKMVNARPFASINDLFTKADQLWNECSQTDQMEAFSHHPRIGGDLETLRKKYQSTAGWASQEQGGVAGASEEVLQALNRGNLDYEAKFGFVFLICATGKSAAEMLDALQKRLPNSKEMELSNAKAEQGKITRIRLEKLLNQLNGVPS